MSKSIKRGHTPTPYRAIGSDSDITGKKFGITHIVGADGSHIAALMGGVEDRNRDGKFIKQACNSHKPLLEALKTLREDIHMLMDGRWIPDEDSCQASIDVADQAIKLAKRGA